MQGGITVQRGYSLTPSSSAARLCTRLERKDYYFYFFFVCFVHLYRAVEDKGHGLYAYIMYICLRLPICCFGGGGGYYFNNY